MQRDEIIDNSIGISKILDRFESDSFLNKILICGSFKQGKTYALKCIEEKFIEKGISDSCIFKLNISDYIISGINDFALQSAYRDASLILQNLVCNSYFAQNEPYLWIQTAITKLEVTSETGESSNNLLSEIMSQFDKFIDIDKQFQIEYYSFKSKNNYTYNIDIQQRETKEAFDYFKKEISIPGKSMYMCSLINHQANTLVIGDYDEVIKLSENTIAIFSAYRELDPYLSAFTNNYIIAEILKDFNILDTMSASYISAFKKTLSTNSKYKISNVLYKINLGLVYFYSGKTEHAFQLYEDLLKEFASEEDVDHYYKYFIINNYNIIGLCTGKLSGYSFIDELKKLNPLPNNKVFFERRNKELQNFVKQLNSILK